MSGSLMRGLTLARKDDKAVAKACFIKRSQGPVKA